MSTDEHDSNADRGAESSTAQPVSPELLKRATPTPPAEPDLHPEGSSPSGAASKEVIPADGEFEHASPVVVPASLDANKTVEAVKEVRDEK